MTDRKTPSTPTTAEAPRAEAVDPRPAYERPRVTRKRAVSHATLFSGGGGPSSAPPLVSHG
jgi:hypothetical protein